MAAVHLLNLSFLGLIWFWEVEGMTEFGMKTIFSEQYFLPSHQAFILPSIICMSLNPVNMNTPNQITINITGQLTLHCKNVEPVLRALQIQAPATNLMTANQSSARPDESSFITEMQLLERLQVSRRTVFSWRMAGKIPTVKLGRRTLYHWPSVEAALLRHQRGGW